MSVWRGGSRNISAPDPPPLPVDFDPNFYNDQLDVLERDYNFIVESISKRNNSLLESLEKIKSDTKEAMAQIQTQMTQIVEMKEQVATKEDINKITEQIVNKITELMSKEKESSNSERERFPYQSLAQLREKLNQALTPTGEKPSQEQLSLFKGLREIHQQGVLEAYPVLTNYYTIGME